jgi:hypothetical protein
MALMICYWNEILIKFQDVSKTLQGEYVKLDQMIMLYKTLELYLMVLRNEERFSTFESKTKLICGSQDYKKDKQRKKLKLSYG